MRTASWEMVAAALRAAAILLALAVAAAPAAAQTFGDYQAMAAPEGPPPPGDGGPQLADYGRLAETYAAGAAIDVTQRQVDRFRERLVKVLKRAPNVASDVRDALERNSPGGDPTFFVGLAVFLIFLIGIGRAVATLLGVYLVRPIFVKLQRQAPNPQSLSDKLPVLGFRVGMMAVLLFATVLTAVAVGSGFYPDDNPVAVRTAIIVFASYVILRFVDVIWRTTLAPYLPEYRIPVFTDRSARKLYVWLYVGTLTATVLGGLMQWMRALELQAEALALLSILSTALTTVVFAVVGWLNREGVTRALLAGREPAEASWLARAAALLWGPFVLAYLVVAMATTAWRMIMELDPGPPLVVTGFATLMAALLVYSGTVFFVERLARRSARRRRRAEPEVMPPPRDEKADGPGMDDGDDGDEEGGGRVMAAQAAPQRLQAHRMRSFEDLARRVASLFALGAGFWALARLWGGPEVFAQGALLDRVQDITDILLIGYIVYHAVRIWIDRKIEAEGGQDFSTEPGDEGGGAATVSRIATLLPLVRNATLFLIVASVGVFIAMEAGVNVAPLFAGAGVVGLAIGFGSQALVRDILSGAFFLVDDAFRRGEYIDVGDVKGTVENISLRSFQLRHHLGALHTIPFGEIKHLTNFSRDWVMMKLPLRLTYDTDVEKVRKLIKKLGQELLEHPEEGFKFLQPLKSQGVYMMEDSAMIIRVKYMTKPGDQWTTRKLVYARIRELFAKEGVKFAHREVTVRIPELEEGGPKALSQEAIQAVGAAARRTVDDADVATAQLPRAVGDDR